MLARILKFPPYRVLKIIIKLLNSRADYYLLIDIFDLDVFLYTRNLYNKRFKPVLVFEYRIPFEFVFSCCENSQWLICCQKTVWKNVRIIAFWHIKIFLMFLKILIKMIFILKIIFLSFNNKENNILSRNDLLQQNCMHSLSPSFTY